MAKGLSGLEKEENAALVLGWNLNRQERGKVIEKHRGFVLSELPGGEKCYYIDSFPALTLEEARFLRGVLRQLQAGNSRPKKEGIRRFLRNYCIRNLIELDKNQIRYCTDLLKKMVFGFGPLQFILQDDEIEEIAVIGVGKEKPVYVFHCRHGWLKTNIFFSSESSVKDMVNKMAAGIGRRLTLNKPVLNATLPNGSRLNAAIWPVSFTGPTVTIRKFKRQPFTPMQLIENRTFSAELMAFLWIAMQCDCSLLIAGNTGSGKTSSLNALFSFVASSERIVIVEETPEIKLQQSHLVKLNVVKEQKISMQKLIVDTLRMRPDRIVVGEVRSREETRAFIDTLLAGQGKGSYATFHSQTCKEAVNRMKAMGIAEPDIGALDLIIVQRRWNKIDAGTGKQMEMRRVIEVSELSELDSAVSLNKLFEYDFTRDRLAKVGESKRILEKAMNCFGMNEKQVRAEIRARACLLDKSRGKAVGPENFLKQVQGKWRE